MTKVHIKDELKKKIDEFKGPESWSEYCSIALSLRTALNITPNIIESKMKNIIDENIDRATRRSLVQTGAYRKMKPSEDKINSIAKNSISDGYRSDSDKKIKITETKDLAKQITDNAKKLAKDVMK